MGTARGFGIEVSALTQPIGRAVAILWLAAAIAMVATAVSLFVWPTKWWMVGAAAVALSQLAVMTSWHDARFGTVANAIALVGVAYGFLNSGPYSFKTAYGLDVQQALSKSHPRQILTEADLAFLPAPVARYIRLSGAVGQPRVYNFRATFRGDIRSGPQARWMPFTGEQHSTIAPASRLFLMGASMFAVPIEAFHRYVGTAATMKVKVLSLVPMVDAAGPAMNRGETVTMFNDMCIFAPGALADPSIEWLHSDGNTVRAAFRNAGNTIQADLIFNDAGELINFVSDDRAAGSADGKSFVKSRWWTPVSDYRSFGDHRLASRGEAQWDKPSGRFTYLRLTIDRVDYNVASPGP